MATALFTRLAALAAPLALALVAGCDGGGGGMCTYDGKVYKTGDSFPSTDGCNTCGCAADGSVACTLIACAPKSCLYNGKVYNPGDSFPSSDGCNTCMCGTDGAVSCTKRACPTAPATSWLIKAPVQCNGNPWQMGTPRGDGMAPSYPDPELALIDNYFEDQGINLMELGLLYPPKGGSVCTACMCGRGDYLLVRASNDDASRLVAEYGFTTVGADEALRYTPRQCGTNPWTAATPAGGRAEAESAAAWTTSQSAPLTKGGFAFRTDPVVVCTACTCPRGDGLIGFPETPAAASKLSTLTFVPLAR